MFGVYSGVHSLLSQKCPFAKHQIHSALLLLERYRKLGCTICGMTEVANGNKRLCIIVKNGSSMSQSCHKWIALLLYRELESHSLPFLAIFCISISNIRQNCNFYWTQSCKWTELSQSKHLPSCKATLLPTTYIITVSSATTLGSETLKQWWYLKDVTTLIWKQLVAYKGHKTVICYERGLVSTDGKHGWGCPMQAFPLSSLWLLYSKGLVHFIMWVTSMSIKV